MFIDKFKNAPNPKLAAAVMLVMYENYPTTITTEQIVNRIIQLGISKMTDEDFEIYAQKILSAKRN